jgi:ketosteroid isomerase-like protein
MSRENVEVVRQSFEAVNRSDAQAMAALCHEDIEFVSMLTAVEEASYRGKDAWETYFRDMGEIWQGWRAQGIEIFEADDERLASVFRMVGTGKRSGTPIEQPVGVTYTFRDGKIWRLRSYLEPSEALKAVGLSE